MKNTPGLVAGVLLVLTGTSQVGCGNAEVAKMREQVAGLENRTVALESSLKALESKVEQYKAEAETKEAFESKDAARLTPSDEGYSVIESDLGRLTVKISDVKQFANGSRVTLKFGNPSSADLSGVSFKVQWGRSTEDWFGDLEKAKEKETKLVKGLAAGAWTDVDVVLEGVPSNELGFVTVSNVSHESISLRVR